MARRFGLALGLCLGVACVARAENGAASGAAALPALRQAAGHPAPDLRQRLAALIGDIERATLLAPKRVTLHLDNVPLKDAVAALAKASGYKIELQAGGPGQLLVSMH